MRYWSGYEPAWTISVPARDDELDTLIRQHLLGEDGLAYWCIECSDETVGVVYHAHEHVTRREIEAALFESFGRLADTGEKRGE